MTSTLYSEQYRAFVRHLIALRKRNGTTQGDLASKLGKPQSYVSKSERFERRIDVAEFAAIVTALGCDPAVEFGRVVTNGGERAKGA
jgi:transcriptional regulator with XRE-family HTH domain